MKKLNVMNTLFMGLVVTALGASFPAVAAQKVVAKTDKINSVKGDWYYDSSSLDRKYASIESDNGFKFPGSESEYPTTLDLELVDFGGNYMFNLTNSDADFNCPRKTACTILISFDGGAKKKVKVEYTDGLDERHINAVRSEYNALYTSLMSAKTMTVQASFKGAGTKVYKFRVGGLKWPAPKR